MKHCTSNTTTTHVKCLNTPHVIYKWLSVHLYFNVETVQILSQLKTASDKSAPSL